MRSINEIIKGLKETDPEALADIVPVNVDIDIDKVDGNTAPSEIKRLTEAIKKKRLTGEGPTEAELREVMVQIGQG